MYLEIFRVRMKIKLAFSPPPPHTPCFMTFFGSREESEVVGFSHFHICIWMVGYFRLGKG